MSLLLKQYDGSQVSALDDAVVYHLLERNNGILQGCVVSTDGSLGLSISAGYGIIYGREFECTETALTCSSQPTSTNARLIIEIDMANSEQPITFKIQYAPFEDLVQENINGSGLIYQMKVAEFMVDSASVTNLVNIDNEVTPHCVNFTLTLTTAGWTQSGTKYTQTVNSNNIKAGANVFVSPAPSSFELWDDCAVYCSAQATYSLTFTATEVPSANMTINIMIVR